MTSRQKGIHSSEEEEEEAIDTTFLLSFSQKEVDTTALFTINRHDSFPFSASAPSDFFFSFRVTDFLQFPLF